MSLSLLPAILSRSSSVSLPHCDRISPLSFCHLLSKSLEFISATPFLETFLDSHRLGCRERKEHTTRCCHPSFYIAQLLIKQLKLNPDLPSGFSRQLNRICETFTFKPVGELTCSMPAG